jgi:hypothetical protein
VKVAVKIICFLWLCLEDRLLTGINYKKRGGIRPSVCTLCLKAEESVTNLFVDCQITQMIWGHILTSLRIDFEWNKATIEENLKFWFLKLPNHKYISLFCLCGKFGNLETKFCLIILPRMYKDSTRKFSPHYKNIYLKRKQIKQTYYLTRPTSTITLLASLMVQLQQQLWYRYLLKIHSGTQHPSTFC